MPRPKQQAHTQQPKSGQLGPKTPLPLLESLPDLEDRAHEHGVLSSPGPATTGNPHSGSPSQAPLELESRLRTLIQAYESAAERQQKQAEAHAMDVARLQVERKELEQVQAEVAAKLTWLADLDERQHVIVAREAEADAGFVKRRRDALRELELQHQKLVDEIASIERATAERLSASQDHALDERSKALLLRETELNHLKGNLQRELFDAQEATRLAGDLRAHVLEVIEERTEQRVEDIREQLVASNAAKAALHMRIVDLEAHLAERNSADSILGRMSPEAVKARLDQLQKRVRELEDELSDRPTESDADELRLLREERQRWHDDRRTLSAERGRLQSALERQLIEVDRLEVLRDRNTALVETQKLLKRALDDLKSEVDERLDARRGDPVFPEMLRMDEHPNAAKSPPMLFPDGNLDLAEFVADLRHRMGRDPTGARPELYYRDEDVRAFVAGLAMSRLHLIQGISGIGKSSLPRAFAAAVGGHCETVSVQASWRDRNDLFGYFNAFERRYYELPFAQAVYRAFTPEWRHRLVVILLDEMNLSHPEQYAADLLDVLERQDPAERRFELLPFTPNGESPAYLQDHRFLPLPPNVWFVGTANNDETTKDFADKTFDRSFVLELPSRPTPFGLEQKAPRPPVRYQALLDAFDRASTDRQHLDSAKEVITWLQAHLQAPLAENFGIGWGGRLDAQIRRYVPVATAAGGSVGEALDSLIATRVFRTIRARHTNDAGELRGLLEVLEQNWPEDSHGPDASTRLLEREIRYLER